MTTPAFTRSAFSTSGGSLPSLRVIASSVFSQAMNETFGMPLLEGFQPRLHRGRVIAQHVEPGIERHDLNLDLFAFVRIILRHVGGDVEHRIHLGGIIVADLERELMLFGGAGLRERERHQQQRE